jgi:hypothetical protein
VKLTVKYFCADILCLEGHLRLESSCIQVNMVLLDSLSKKKNLSHISEISKQPSDRGLPYNTYHFHFQTRHLHLILGFLAGWSGVGGGTPQCPSESQVNHLVDD